MAKVYRYKVTGDLYELVRVQPDGNYELFPKRPTPPGDLTPVLIAAPSELELVPEPNP